MMRKRSVTGSENDALQLVIDGFQFPNVRARLPRKEVNVHGGDRRALERCCRIADEHRLETMPIQQLGDPRENRPGVVHAYQNSRSKFAVVISAIRSGVIPRTSARRRTVSTTNAGSFRFPRCGTGARYGQSVSTRIRSSGGTSAAARSVSAFGNVNTPPKLK